MDCRLLRSAMASKLAYSKDFIDSTSIRRIRPLLHDVPNALVHRINCKRSGARVYVWDCGDNSTLLSFKGSDSPRDFYTFLNYRPVSFHFADASVQIHGGILNMFSEIESELSEVLSTQRKYITFCGHSQGGSHALLAAAYYGNMFSNRVISCHTFGAPRVGDEAFLNWLNSGLFMII